MFCKFIEFNLNIKEIILIEKKKCYARATKFIRMFGHVQDSFKTIKTTIKLVDFYQAALVLKNIVFFLFSKHNEHIKRSLNLRGKKNIHIIYTKNSKYYCLKHENEALKNKIFGFMCFFFFFSVSVCISLCR